jgi:aryl-alcohol dehydrogenase-like predicted oxidoreductase
MLGGVEGTTKERVADHAVLAGTPGAESPEQVEENALASRRPLLSEAEVQTINQV